MAEAVLHFPLQEIREAIAEGGIDAPDVVAPFRAALFKWDSPEELLVPTQRAEELWSDFVFRLDIVSDSVGIPDTGHLETRFVGFCPQLEVMPREGEILCQNELSIVADAATERKRRRSDLEEIRTGAGGEAEIPHFVRAKAH